MPSLPCPRRDQKEASMAFKRAASPGVPASTSRNGASAPRTCWLAFRRAAPVSRASVCASSSSTANGRRRQRETSAATKSRAPFDGVHSAEPMDAMPTSRGRSLASPRRGANESTSDAGPESALGVSNATSTLGSCSAQARWNQRRSTVLPLPRGPTRTMLCGGASPLLKPARQRPNTACSVVRPVSAGGIAPSPALKTHVVADSMRSSIRPMVVAPMSTRPSLAIAASSVSLKVGESGETKSPLPAGAA